MSLGPAVGHLDGDDPEFAGVQPGAAICAEQMLAVRVIGHLDDVRRIPALAISTDELQIEGVRTRSEQMRQLLECRVDLRTAVFGQAND